jgi:hypothetical protein
MILSSFRTSWEARWRSLLWKKKSIRLVQARSDTQPRLPQHALLVILLPNIHISRRWCVNNVTAHSNRADGYTQKSKDLFPQNRRYVYRRRSIEAREHRPYILDTFLKDITGLRSHQLDPTGSLRWEVIKPLIMFAAWAIWEEHVPDDDYMRERAENFVINRGLRCNIAEIYIRLCWKADHDPIWLLIYYMVITAMMATKGTRTAI